MNFEEMIDSKQLKIGVIGMGYVGLPLAVSFAEKDFSVLGFDVNVEKTERINRGTSPISDVTSSQLTELVQADKIEATADMSRLAEVDMISICVPTPLRKSRDPDISYIAQATQTIVENFKPPGIVVLESTTYPGTTDEILAEAFESAGWDLEEELLLAFSPERIDPGNPDFGMENTPKVVGGYNRKAGELVSKLYGVVSGEIVTVSGTRVAEMVKLLENTFRSINIGLANEMALICDRMGINVWEVIRGAASKPFGFMPFYPGPGLGGHCIPIDPLFLSWRAKLHNTSTRFIELADEINRSMPRHVFTKITGGLNEFERSVKGSKICVFGVAYKPDVGDTRESPAFEIISLLLDHGAEVVYCDPYVEEFKVEGIEIQNISPAELEGTEYDAAVIITNHSDFNWEQLLTGFNLAVDTRNALENGTLSGDSLKVISI
ncbi:MAG: nucleotide sugar dehydrogenase [bacterium]